MFLAASRWHYVSSLTASKKTILDRGFGASTCLNSDRGVLPASRQRRSILQEAASVSRKFVCSQCSEACLAVLAVGPAAQRHSGPAACLTREFGRSNSPKQTRQGGPRKPHNVSSLEAPPIRHPTVGMLQFLI